jgi:DMSO/TMAO reductase YedYZ molybdopterin-dependent catalytic subunit
VTSRIDVVEYTAGPPSVTVPSHRFLGAILGLLAAGVAIGVAQLVAGFVSREASPVIAVGSAAIDLTPEWLKSFAIRTFGEQDKLVLLGGIGVVLAVVAVILGILSVRRRIIGLVGLAVFGALGVTAALTRPTSTLVDALPSVVGAAAGALTLVSLRARIPLDGQDADGAVAPAIGVERRRFLLGGLAAVGAAVAAGGLGQMLSRRFAADESRAAVAIPEAGDAAAAAPAGADFGIDGLSPFFTPNEEFYRVDTALIVPAVAAEDWSLRVHGMVDREITLKFEQLVARDLIERDITLACVSNEVGGEYIGNARWVGAPLAALLEEAGVDPAADQLVSRSVDGFTVGTPTAAVMDGRDAMLAVRMNGEPLPLEHGFPVRILVPGLYGYVSATKWVTELELSTFDAFDPYWIKRGWAEQAPIKTQSRIDTPKPLAKVPAQGAVIAGVAWAQHRGIDRVEVRIDEGPWLDAELSAQDTIDTWRQWRYPWTDATPGNHSLQVRATDADSDTQTPDRAEPFPDGATGQHQLVVALT